MSGAGRRIATGSGLLAMLWIVVAAAPSNGGSKPRVIYARVVRVSAKRLINVEWSPVGRRLAALSEDNALYIVDARTGKRLERWRFRRPMDYARLRPDWKVLATRAKDGRVQLWEVKRRRYLRTLRLNTGIVWGGAGAGMEWSPDGSRLAVTDFDERHYYADDPKTGKHRLRVSERSVVRIFDAVSGRQVHVLRHRTKVGPVIGHGSESFEVAWKPDGTRIATALASNVTWSSPVQIWNAATGRRVTKPDLASEGCSTGLAWWPGKRKIQKRTGVFRPILDSPTPFIDPERWPIRRLYWSADSWAWSREGEFLAARIGNDIGGYASDNVAPIRVWRASNGAPAAELRQRGCFLEGLTWSPDGRRIASAGDDGTVRIWDVRTIR